MRAFPALPIALAIVLCLSSLFSAVTEAAPPWRSLELSFERTIHKVDVIPWQKGRAISVFSRKGNDTRLSIIRLKDGHLRWEAQWVLPPELRWLAPLHLPGTEPAWLGLLGKAWQLGRLEGGAQLNWRLLCHCPSLFTKEERSIPISFRLIEDLDGDGCSELMLPTTEGLMVYALPGNVRSPPTPGKALTLLWRNHWDLQAGQKGEKTFQLPRFVFRDVDGDGVRDFIRIHPRGLEISSQPAPRAGGVKPHYIKERYRLNRWKKNKLPPTLLSALERMPSGAYRSPQAFRVALSAVAEVADQTSWENHLPAVLAIAREEAPVFFGQRLDLPALKKGDENTEHDILDVADLNGDGLLDVVHVLTSNKGRPWEQKNELRWYRGSRHEGKLTFKNAPQLFFSEGPAIADLVSPDPQGRQTSILVLATAEGGLMSLLRSLAANELTLKLFVYSWDNQKLAAPPATRGSLNLEVRRNKKINRPKLLLADLDGDGWREFIFNKNADTLTAFKGNRQGANFKGGALAETKVILPQSRESIFVADLDGDGREELILWYAHAKGKSARTLSVVRMAPSTP